MVTVGLGTLAFAAGMVLLGGSLLSELRADPLAAREAGRIAAEAAYAHLTGRLLPNPETRVLALRRPSGAFVTVVRDGKVRGCWGSIGASQPDLAREIAAAAAKAMHLDYRHRPVNIHEWGDLELVVSVVGPLRRLQWGQHPDPIREGLFITTGGRGAVLLPGEARTARYQRAEVLRKAGIRPSDPGAAAFRFETWTASYRVADGPSGFARAASGLRRLRAGVVAVDSPGPARLATGPRHLPVRAVAVDSAGPARIPGSGKMQP